MLAVTAAGLAVLIGLLAVPLVFVINVERAATVEVTWRVRWLYGLVEVGPSWRPGRRLAAGAQVRESARAFTRKRPWSLGTVLAVLRTPGLLGSFSRLARALGRTARVDDFALSVRLGCDDPADTGIVHGIVSPWLALAALRGWTVDCRPTFVETGVMGTLHGTIRVRPSAVLGTVVAFFVSPPVLRAIWTAWRVPK
jgi:hypothetical protein